MSLIVHSDAKLKNSVLNVLYKVGSAQEESHQTGLAHFLEHMMFEGSQNFPHFDTTLQRMMAENNAFTGQDHTCYYASFPHEHLKDVLRIERDRMQALSLKKSSVEMQSKVILEEFKETSLNPPMADVWHHLQRLCFRNNYQWPVIGKNLQHIHRIDKKALSGFYRKFYTPQNSIITVVTSYSSVKVANMIAKIFETKLLETMIAPTKTPEITFGKVNGYKKVYRKNIAVPSFFMAFHIDDYATKGYFLSDMASDLLTNGESSLLYQALVLDKRLCTEIQSYTTDNVFCNLMIIEGKLCSHSDFEHVYAAIGDVFAKVINTKLGSMKFETLVNKALSYWSFYHYNSAQLAQNMAIYYQAAGVLDIHEYIDRMYNSIRKKDLESHLKSLLNMEQASILEYHTLEIKEK